jgi:signal transduction histidine kinase
MGSYPLAASGFSPISGALQRVTICAVTTAVAVRSTGQANRGALWPAAGTGLGVTAVVLTCIAGVVGPGHPSLPATALHVVAALTYVIVGGIAWLRRPANRTGMLMTIAGIGWCVGDLIYVPSPQLQAVGYLLNIAWFGVLGHLVVAFPSGRLDTGLDKTVVALAYIVAVCGNMFPEILFAAPGTTDVFALHHDAVQHDVVQTAQETVNVIVSAVVVGVLALHYREGTLPARRALAPAFWASGPMLLAVVLLSIPALITSAPWLQSVLPIATPIALASLPVTFVIGLLRSRLSIAAIGHLVVELGASPPADELRDALSRALHDPSLTVAYRVPRRQGWFDSDGHPTTLPAAPSSRTFTLLERHGEPVAALVHDRSLEHDPTLVAGVAAAASLAIENERLQAAVGAPRAQVRASRARLVTVADQERRRLERDLHDGAQQRLIALSMSLGRIAEQLDTGRHDGAREAVRSAEEQLRAALVELRQLAAGIRPAILTDAGLGAALEALAEQAPVPVTVRADINGRLPDTVESAAYFAVCEALTNVAKHGDAASATVDARVSAGRLIIVVADDGVGGVIMARGSGLRGLADRIGALDGTIDVESPDGGGTRVRVELPCA